MSPKVWLITGASHGFGTLLTQIVLENGDIAVATARRPSALSDLTARYPAERLLVLKLDVTQPQDITAAFAVVKEKLGRLDVVVNNAGYGSIGEIEAVDVAEMREMVETNFWGMANVSKEAVRFFREVNPAGVGGRLLNFSSTSGVKGIPGLAYYSASKFALDGFSEALAAELDPAWNIKVTVVVPGTFDTGAAQSIVIAPPHPAYTNPQLPTVVLRNVRDMALFKMKDPRKAMEVVYKLGQLADPPMHFPLGLDAVAAIKQKSALMLEEAEKYESWSEILE